VGQVNISVTEVYQKEAAKMKESRRVKLKKIFLGVIILFLLFNVTGYKTIAAATSPIKGMYVEQKDGIVRKGASATHAKVFVLNKGAIVTVHTNQKGWMNISFGKKKGYIQSSKIKLFPTIPSVDPVDDNDTVIKGKAEKSNTVYLKINKQTIATATSDKTGNFSLTVKSLKAGTSLSFSTKDPYGNVSPTKVLVVLDKTAPRAPEVNPVKDTSAVVSGKSEKQALIQVLANDSVIGQGTANGNGQFSIGIPIQAINTTLVVIAKDKAGNQVESVTLTVTDGTPPILTNISEIDETSNQIKGLSEPKSIIQIKRYGQIIASGITDDSGQFSITITPQTAGQMLTVIAVDSAGNESSPQTVFVKEGPMTFLELNKGYVSPDNQMTVKITNLSIVDAGGFNEYTFTYEQQNNTSDKVIDEGTFKIYYEDGTSESQYGFFGKLYPGENRSRTYTYKALKGLKPICIEYGADTFFRKKPIKNSLKWEMK
jgi:hypothetical protein